MAKGTTVSKKQVYNIVLWKWQQENMPNAYSPEYVNIMQDMLERNLHDVNYRIICVTDDDIGVVCDTYPLWKDCGELLNPSGPSRLPSCFRRLRLYDHETQKDMGIKKGERIVSIDLDTVVCGPLRDMLAIEGRFVGWQLVGQAHPRVFNGSFQMFTAGDLQHIWSDFDPRKSPRVAREAGFFGSDQAWLSYNLVDKEGSNHIPYPVLASYPLHCVHMSQFKREHRLVFFHGKRKPWSPEAQAASPWIGRNWRYL